MSGQHILIVDDEEKMRRVLEIMLQRMGYRVSAAANGEEAFEHASQQAFDLIISDLRMPGMDGATLLSKLRAAGIEMPLIIVTAHGTIESAVDAMKLGACDYILRPFDIDALKLSINRILAAGQIRQHNDFLRNQLEEQWSGLTGDSAAMRHVQEQIRLVAAGKTTVLLTGETGTGKELVAHAIHHASPRREQLFVPINCAAIPAEIIESELFGYDKGAFTGANKDRIGKFELANGGTLFLDELTEMPLALQAKLLRVLQENVVERLGSNRTIPLDVRIIAATNRDPHRAVAEGRLREDLYYRINVFSIELPPLRQRREDIATLVAHFIDEFAKNGHARAGLSTAALARLIQYEWPGNVRELKNVIERAVLLSRGGTIEADHLNLVSRPEAATVTASDVDSDLDLNRAVDAVESELIAEALRRTGGNKTKAANLLHISGRSLWYKLKKLNLDDGIAAPDGD